MYAIVNIKGCQYKVTENQKVFIPKLKDDIGSKVSFSEVLMFTADDKSFEIGAPVLSKTVEATVLNHVKDDTVIVFKKKRRKGYKVRNGHRQNYTQIEINSIK
ncbi:MAG: 50S ribosomal protein L21 [Ignavibacteriae bacterium]|nr:50S ribosomal protein L21 [Ignavibacteriota bacterium]